MTDSGFTPEGGPESILAPNVGPFPHESKNIAPGSHRAARALEAAAQRRRMERRAQHG